MVRSTLVFLSAFGFYASAAQAQALNAGAAAHAGMNGVALPNGNQVTPQFIEGLIQQGQQGAINTAQSSRWVNGNNGFGYYSPAFAVGGTGMGLPGLNGISNYGYGYGAYGAYGINSLSPLLMSRTIGNSNYYGNTQLNNIPYGVNNLYGLMPNGGQPAMANVQQVRGSNTIPGQGIVGSTRGNSEASAILNGALPSKANPRTARKGGANARRATANRAR